MPFVSMAGMNAIDDRVYVSWSEPEYNKIVFFTTSGGGSCTAEYVDYDLILTARHCVTNKSEYDGYEKLNREYQIQLYDGRKTKVVLERYGHDLESEDWALLRVKDNNFYQYDNYFDVINQTPLGPVSLTGFGFLRVLSDDEIKTIRNIFQSMSARYRGKSWDFLWNKTEEELARRGIYVNDFDRSSGTYRLKSHQNCQISRFVLSVPNVFETTCDSIGGNSGGPYYLNGVLHGIVSRGYSSFDEEGYTWGVKADGFVKQVNEMRSSSDKNNPNVANQPITNSNNCVIDGTEYEKGKNYNVNREVCSNYNKKYDFGLRLYFSNGCDCMCNNDKFTCSISKCINGFHLENGICTARTTKEPTATAQNKCIINGEEYDDGITKVVSVDKCATFNSALNLEYADSCTCTCRDGKMNCEIETCKDGYNNKDGICIADDPVVVQPVSNGSKCLSRGKVYNHGESQSVGSDLCVKIDGAMATSYTRMLRTCKCTCNDGKMNCEIESCINGYRPEGGQCVSDSSSGEPLFKKPQMALSKNTSSPGSVIVHPDRPFEQDELGELSDDEKIAIQDKIQRQSDALDNDLKDVTSKTDKEFFHLLNRMVELNELRKRYEEALARERSLPNRVLGAVSIGATGIGGMMAASALSEQAADAQAEREMQAYLKTFTCEYGGNRVDGGETNVELPGGNDMISLYTEYATLANDLKMRKELLGIAPGIESEVSIDKADTGLYDDVGTGITGGVYASIARAIMNPDGEDAAKWNEQKENTGQQLKIGATVAGAGAIGGAVGNVLINYTDQDDSEEISEENEE